MNQDLYLKCFEPKEGGQNLTSFYQRVFNLEQIDSLFSLKNHNFTTQNGELILAKDPFEVFSVVEVIASRTDGLLDMLENPNCILAELTSLQDWIKARNYLKEWMNAGEV